MANRVTDLGQVVAILLSIALPGCILEELGEPDSAAEEGDFIASISQALSACDNNGFFQARLNLLGHEGRWHVHVHATCEPEVAGQPRTASGLVAIVPAVDALARQADPSPAGDGM